jgi:hypothetical protein
LSQPRRIPALAAAYRAKIAGVPERDAAVHQMAVVSLVADDRKALKRQRTIKE